MRIGIFVHSKTGNTYSVAEKLQTKLKREGHDVILERIEPSGGETGNETAISQVVFDKKPEVSQYDAVIFGGPVRGFSISVILKAHLLKVKDLNNKKTGILVTEYFPHPWMGGRHTMEQIRKLCEAKGAKIYGTGLVNWSNKKREIMITDAVEKLSKL